MYTSTSPEAKNNYHGNQLTPYQLITVLAYDCRIGKVWLLLNIDAYRVKFSVGKSEKLSKEVVPRVQEEIAGHEMQQHPPQHTVKKGYKHLLTVHPVPNTFATVHPVPDTLQLFFSTILAIHPTLPAIHPTLPVIHPTLPAIHPTLAAIHPTLPVIHPTLPAIHPTLPAIHPTLPAIHPTLPVIHPTLPAIHPTLPGFDTEGGGTLGFPP